MGNGTVAPIKLGIQAWSSWEPLDDSSVCINYRDGKMWQEELQAPQLKSVPPMQRRRLSPMARVVFEVLGRCLEGGEPGPLIFSSVMGEIRRTQGILDSLAVDEAVSPAAFSLSVHNSVAGLWSLIQNSTAPMLALAPNNESPVPALIEAAGVLREGRYASVLVVYCEEAYPDFYEPYMSSPPGPTALALRLVPAGTQANALTLCMEGLANEGLTKEGLANEGLARAGPGDTSANHSALAKLLQQKESRVTVVEPQSRWQLALAG